MLYVFTPIFVVALFTISKTRNSLKDELDKQNVVYVYNRILFGL